MVLASSLHRVLDVLRGEEWSTQFSVAVPLMLVPRLSPSLHHVPSLVMPLVVNQEDDALDSTLLRLL